MHITYDYTKYSALVPVKELALAKSRLAAHLSWQQREKLVLEMLQHVVSTLSESEIFEQVYVVSADTRVLELVQHWGAEPLRETQQGHNPALQAAAQTILDRAAWRHGLYTNGSFLLAQALSEQGNNPQGRLSLLESLGLLTISADLPLLTGADVHALIAQARHAQIVLAGSSDGTGTNAVLMRPPLALPYCFGPNSLPGYIQMATQHTLSYTLVSNAHLALDIDTIDDLHELERHRRAWSPLAHSAM